MLPAAITQHVWMNQYPLEKDDVVIDGGNS